MECEHEWVNSEIKFGDEGYMRMQHCKKCLDVNGTGFLNKQHEINYLNTLLEEKV